MREHRPCVAVVMGVAGSGKTTIGRALAQRLGWKFQEGDALHPPANVEKMRAGQPLDDADRLPWLKAIAACIDEWQREGVAGVVACSALKRSYRDLIIGERPGIRLVYLAGSRALLAERLARRRGHFMPPSLLESQLATLEPPSTEENTLTISIKAPVESIVGMVAEDLTGNDPHGAARCGGTITRRNHRLGDST